VGKKPRKHGKNPTRGKVTVHHFVHHFAQKTIISRTLISTERAVAHCANEPDRKQAEIAVSAGKK